MKILAATFVVSVGRPFRNADGMIKIMDENEADVYLFPAYCLTGASCSALAHYKCFAEETNEALDKLCEYTEKTGKCFVTAVYGYDNIIVRNGDLIQKPTVKIGKTVVKNKTTTVKKGSKISAKDDKGVRSIKLGGKVIRNGAKITKGGKLVVTDKAGNKVTTKVKVK